MRINAVILTCLSESLVVVCAIVGSTHFQLVIDPLRETSGFDEWIVVQQKAWATCADKPDSHKPTGEAAGPVFRGQGCGSDILGRS